MSNTNHELGISGKLARFFQTAQITPLLGLMALLFGVFAVLVTPREEEPQINVTMANVLIPFPGASAKDVEQMVSTPAEQVLSQIADIEHVMSVSQTGLSVVTVQFKVGVPRTEALVRLHDTVSANSDWLPQGLGVMPPIIKPLGIDDVPIMAITLHGIKEGVPAGELEKIANNIEIDIKRISGTREVKTIGGPQRAIRADLDPEKMAKHGVTYLEVRQILSGTNFGSPVGDLLQNEKALAIETGPYLKNANDVENIVLAIRQGQPVYLKDVATIHDGSAQIKREVLFGEKNANATQTPAVTVSVTKKPGANAIDVARLVEQRLKSLEGTKIPSNIKYDITRNYGETANEKAVKLIQKLFFATLSVVALVLFALGRREALIVGLAVILTLAATLFASWAWGFTINRVSLFALIFSIGILVDDAIVVVENIHRHQSLTPNLPLKEIIPKAVDEVGGPTILATLTVIAALLPMAFVSGLMGPYMSPIPINASMGMLISLAIAFILTPWMSLRWMKSSHTNHSNQSSHASESKVVKWLTPMFGKIFNPLLNENTGRRNRFFLGLGVFGAIAFSMLLPIMGAVVLKMLPFDNKSEFQVILDMPAGTRLEKTTTTLREMGQYLAKIPEVSDYQIYSGTAAPINFNGLVRQYAFRQNPYQGDIQVNLVHKNERSDKSHIIAQRVRPELVKIAQKHGGNVKVVEVPPGPPVLSPIVAEIYGPSSEGRLSVAKGVRNALEKTTGIVDIDDSSIAQAPKKILVINRRKANLMGVPQQAIVATLRSGLSGDSSAYLHDASKYPAPVILRLPENKQENLDDLLNLTIRTPQRETVKLKDLVDVVDTTREQIIYHKDLLPVNYVVADTAVQIDSPLYGLFAARGDISKIKTPDQKPLEELFISQPDDPYKHYSIKWDGESQVTYETFRDMGLAYAVGLILIYLLVVAHFGSYLMPLIIMAPIPLTIIGVMPGHALLRAPFTATSMIGMIALAGIIVRNSILLVDFIRIQTEQGMSFAQAVVNSAITRAQPIILTGLAAMLGAFFILDDPIFNGLAISLIFGIFVSTILTLVVIPLLYFAAFSGKVQKKQSSVETA
jgi:multidrug efflux pump subunit AcrB